MFQKTPLRVARLQLRLRAACCRSASWFLRTVQFPDQTRFDFGLRSNARFDVRVYFATKLATVGIQLMYSLVYSLLLAGVRVNYYSINRGVGLPLQRAQDYSPRQRVQPPK